MFHNLFVVCAGVLSFLIEETIAKIVVVALFPRSTYVGKAAS